MIVVDIGCVDWVAEISLEPLIERFVPDAYYGFDPALGIAKERTYRGCPCSLAPTAAWVYDGWVGFHMDGPRSYVTDAVADGEAIACFDLGRFLREQMPHDIILKLDVEGAEYALLEHLHEGGEDALVTRMLVEWHDDGGVESAAERLTRKRRLLANLRCTVEDWE